VIPAERVSRLKGRSGVGREVNNHSATRPFQQLAPYGGRGLLRPGTVPLRPSGPVSLTGSPGLHWGIHRTLRELRLTAEKSGAW
jgi:hypothetical protein